MLRLPHDTMCVKWRICVLADVSMGVRVYWCSDVVVHWCAGVWVCGPGAPRGTTIRGNPAEGGCAQGKE